MDDIFQPFERQGIVFESENQVQEVMELVMDLSNNVRLWENNGLTPHELHNRIERPMMTLLPDEPYHVMVDPGMSQNTSAAPRQDGKAREIRKNRGTNL
ncbi:hypothetical protein [Lentibacillus halodurans]|uniref:hypothetical protein n=1 Tax=Lentibacillus halodurans TaxID=237679 RepID=UPI001BA7E3FE|nr:hypothetical protein [Lentibacillus halodurans]